MLKKIKIIIAAVLIAALFPVSVFASNNEQFNENKIQSFFIAATILRGLSIPNAEYSSLLLIAFLENVGIDFKDVILEVLETGDISYYPENDKWGTYICVWEVYMINVKFIDLLIANHRMTWIESIDSQYFLMHVLPNFYTIMVPFEPVENICYFLYPITEPGAAENIIYLMWPGNPDEVIGASRFDLAFSQQPGGNGNGDNGSNWPSFDSILDFIIHIFIPREDFWEYHFDRLDGRLREKLPFQTYIDTVGRLSEVVNALEGSYYSVFDITYELEGREFQLDIGRHIAPHLHPLRMLVTGFYVLFLAYYNYRQIMFLIRGRNYESGRCDC